MKDHGFESHSVYCVVDGDEDQLEWDLFGLTIFPSLHLDLLLGTRSIPVFNIALLQSLGIRTQGGSYIR